MYLKLSEYFSVLVMDMEYVKRFGFKLQIKIFHDIVLF